MLALLGVDEDEDDIAADFALTELSTDRLVAEWRATCPGRSPRWPGYGRAPGEVMRLFLADLAATYGSVHAYPARHLGVDCHLVPRLRARLLE